MADDLYSVEQVAELLGLHVRTVRNYVRDGRLKAVRIGKQYRISRANLEELTGGGVRHNGAGVDPSTAQRSTSRRWCRSTPSIGPTPIGSASC